MKFNTDGLILTEQTIKENDRLVTVLTRSEGIIKCFVRGAKNAKNRNHNSTQLFSYSRMSIYEKGNKYTIDEAELVRVFFPLLDAFEGIALAQYLGDLAIAFVPEGSSADEYLSLMLNTFYIINIRTKPLLMVKAVCEIRLMTIAGFMPDLLCCKECGCYESEEMYFLPEKGELLCKDCYNGDPASIRLSMGAVTAMRHSAYAESKKLFSFAVSGKALGQFADCAEMYVLSRSERSSFQTLDFFKAMTAPVQ